MNHLAKTRSTLVITIFLLSSSYSLFSQSDTSLANPLLEEVPEFSDEFRDMGMLRFKANHFYHKMIQVTEPSVVSSLWDLNSNSSGKKSYILHGDIYLPVGMGGYGWRIGKKMIHTLQFIPQVYVRILRDDDDLGDVSLPVRTPSYIPRLLWNFSLDNLWNYHEMKWSYYGAVSAFHHSNGQDGNEINPDGSINTYNGNFGEDVAFEFRLGATKSFLLKPKKKDKNWKYISRSYQDLDSIRKRKLDRAATNSKMTNVPYQYVNEVNHRIAFEWHPKGLSNDAFSQFDLYGRYRINYLFNFRKIKQYQSMFFKKGSKNYQLLGDKRWEESYRISLKTTLIAGPLNTGNVNDLQKAKLEDRINMHLSFYWMVKGSDNAAVFARASYMGSDEYNIYFQDHVWLARLGIAFGFFNHG